ncbi:MAG: winged helix-turn-helix domain-containing protein [Pseudomonadota bacterium]
MVEAEPDITLAEIAERLQVEYGERFAASTVHTFFRRHGVSWKKNRARRRAGA